MIPTAIAVSFDIPFTAVASYQSASLSRTRSLDCKGEDENTAGENRSEGKVGERPREPVKQRIAGARWLDHLQPRSTFQRVFACGPRPGRHNVSNQAH